MPSLLQQTSEHRVKGQKVGKRTESDLSRPNDFKEQTLLCRKWASSRKEGDYLEFIEKIWIRNVVQLQGAIYKSPDSHS